MVNLQEDPVRALGDKFDSTLGAVTALLEEERKSHTIWNQIAPVLVPLLLSILTFIGVWQVSLYKIDTCISEIKDLELSIDRVERECISSHSGIENSLHTYKLNSATVHAQIYANKEKIGELKQSVLDLRRSQYINGDPNL